MLLHYFCISAKVLARIAVNRVSMGCLDVITVTRVTVNSPFVIQADGFTHMLP